MIRKKLYTKPQLTFEEVEASSPFCDGITGSAHGKPVIDEDRPTTAKLGYFEDEFEEPYEEIDPWEESSNYLNQNW